MVDQIYSEKLLPLAKLCQRFPGIFDRTEIELLESSSPRVLPALTGKLPAQSQRQMDFINVLMGKSEPNTRAETVWRKFVVLQQLADESARMQIEIETAASTRVTLKSKVLALQHSLEAAKATIQDLETAALAVMFNNKRPEDCTAADIDLILCTSGLERLRQTQMSQLFNRMLMLDYDPQKLQLVRDRLSQFNTTRWTPDNEFGVYANTDGQ